MSFFFNGIVYGTENTKYYCFLSSDQVYTQQQTGPEAAPFVSRGFCRLRALPSLRAGGAMGSPQTLPHYAKRGRPEGTSSWSCPGWQSRAQGPHRCLGIKAPSPTWLSTVWAVRPHENQHLLSCRSLGGSHLYSQQAVSCQEPSPPTPTLCSYYSCQECLDASAQDGQDCKQQGMICPDSNQIVC